MTREPLALAMVAALMIGAAAAAEDTSAATLLAENCAQSRPIRPSRRRAGKTTTPTRRDALPPIL